MEIFEAEWNGIKIWILLVILISALILGNLFERLNEKYFFGVDARVMVRVILFFVGLLAMVLYMIF